MDLREGLPPLILEVSLQQPSSGQMFLPSTTNAASQSFQVHQSSMKARNSRLNNFSEHENLSSKAESGEIHCVRRMAKPIVM